MLTKLFFVVSLFSLCLYLYGVLVTITVSEKNVCNMTYMFEYPQYVKINFDANLDFPKYNLYAYSEGRLTENARNMKFDGAPVIFVPGNRGSYKQVRSLASVALRKGIDNLWSEHLDYFAVDFNEEYSALYGGYLDDQTDYLGACVDTVLNLYRNLPNGPKSVVIVGHSMGGKIAQALLTDYKKIDLINTVVMLSTPVDRPVLNLDNYFEIFYRKINAFWTLNRSEMNEVKNTTNTCCINQIGPAELTTVTADDNDDAYPLNKKLLITIGGGSRDILVHSALTRSKFSDVHAIATSVPNVWLTTDHLCAVWCLQQTLVINRFLYSIIEPIKNRNQGQHFIEDKSVRLQRAKHYFTPKTVPRKLTSVKLVHNHDDLGDWVEDSRRVFTEVFKSGITETRYQMIRLYDIPQTQILDVEAINVDTDDWVFGCAATEVTSNMRYCSEATSLTHLTRKVPSRRYERLIITIDLHKIKHQYPAWTHVLLRIRPTIKPLQLNVDVHGEGDREIEVTMPKWYSFSNKILLSDTLVGSIAYTIKVTGLEEAYQSLELEVKPRTCSKKQHHAVAKLCVPWTVGFDRYHHFTDTESEIMQLNVPMAKPSSYNTTENPVTVKLNLDPNCRYQISVKNSFAMTLARIVQQFSHWLPSHLVAILLLAFKHQISLTPSKEIFKCGALYSALINCSSFFIITASRVFVKVLFWAESLPNPDPVEHTLLVSIIMHGSALALLTVLTGAVWALISLSGNIAYKILIRAIRFPLPTISGVLLPIIQKFPISIGVILISIAMASCGGLAIIGAVFVYFILLAKMYEDYLEEFIFKTAKLIAQKLFGKSTDEQNDDDADDASTTEPGQPDELNANENNVDAKELLSDNLNTNENTEDADEANEQDTKNDETDENEFEILEKQKPNSDTVAENTDETDFDPEVTRELEKLISETKEKYAKAERDKMNMETMSRVEFDGIAEGLSNLHFHLTLFLLLVILAVLNIPSVITWANDYHYSRSLKADPSLLPAVFTLISLCYIWQSPTPRDINGYKFLANVLYFVAAIVIIYCQDSVYRINAIISIVFAIITLHQVCGKVDAPVEETPAEKELREKVQKIREGLFAESMLGETMNVET
ncbi:GPI inositol-deacylase [Bradysia coprophila]|uniref:GPI inositol-deacylase n=1 Tax=Bradysia coprophila TaxID=38358 RepID=UPI00187DD7BD|nr:GPI inositol-deacylase [Bradysia coprophila]